MTRSALLIPMTLALSLPVFGCGTQGDGSRLPGDSPRGTGLLIVAYAAVSADTFTAVGTDSLTVLEWLRQACDSSRIPLSVEHYAFGDLVSRIGPKRNGNGGNWLYKVNGQMVPKAASHHRVSPDDSVLFFFD